MRWRTLSVVGWCAPSLACAALIAGAMVWSAHDGSTAEPRAATASGDVEVASAALATGEDARARIASGTDHTGFDDEDRSPAARLVLVGDSLAQEAAPVLQFLIAPTEVVPKYWGGTAPCDWLDDDLEADPDTTVVISFTGNSLTACMEDGSGRQLADEELVDAYRRDVTTLVERARADGAPVVLIGQPVRAASFDADLEVAGINALYRSLAAGLDGVSYFDAGAAVEAPDGTYTERLPCSPYDTDCAADGSTVVRGDGVHFCPVAGQNPCPVWSSGAFRFALGLAEATEHVERYD
ncbi:MAG: hypothetical protein AB7L17_03380 [Ilumatobacteraceae bacterium]